MNRDADGSEVNPQRWPAAERWTNELEAFSEGQRQLEKARARLLNPSAVGVRGPSWRIRPWALWALGVAPTLAAAAFLLTRAKPAAQPSFTVQGSSGLAVAAKPGNEFSASPGQPSVLSFWDGSQVRLLTGAKAKVSALGVHGARLELLNGEAEVHITHSPNSTWAVDVGSFRIAVLGTHFFVSKLATGPGLAIRLVEGSVSVSGPCLSVPVRVSTGEQRLLRCEVATEVAAPAPSTAHESSVEAVASGVNTGRVPLEANAPKPPSALRQEVELMERIRAASTVDPAYALSLIHEAGKRFPKGALSEERQAFEALSLDRLGRTSEASALAKSFLQRYPNGSFSARMKGLVSKGSP